MNTTTATSNLENKFLFSDDVYVKPSYSKITVFFASISGANKHILKTCSSMAVHLKVLLGAVMMISCSFEGLAGGYMAYTFFNPIAGFVFGPIWGYFNLRLDQYMINAFSSLATAIFPNATKAWEKIMRVITILAMQLLLTAARLMLVYVFCYFSSKGAEMALFDKEIHKYITEQVLIEQKTFNAETDAKTLILDEQMKAQQELLNDASTKHDAYLAGLFDDIKNTETEIRSRETQLQGEIDGTLGSKTPGFKARAIEKKRALEDEKARLIIKRNEYELAKTQAPTAFAYTTALDDYKKFQATYKERMDSLQSDINKGKKTIQAKGTDGFRDREKALAELAKDPQTAELFKMTWYVLMLITMLPMGIKLLTDLFALFIGNDEYAEACARDRQLHEMVTVTPQHIAIEIAKLNRILAMQATQGQYYEKHCELLAAQNPITDTLAQQMETYATNMQRFATAKLNANSATSSIGLDKKMQVPLVPEIQSTTRKPINFSKVDFGKFFKKLVPEKLIQKIAQRFKKEKASVEPEAEA